MFFVLIITTVLAQLILPWWIVSPIAFIISFLFNKNAKHSFFICFAAVYTAWFIISFYLSFTNDHILANRIAILLGLPTDDYGWIWILLISALPGAITAGLAGLAGQYTKKYFSN
ncbi:hypothetical protein H8S90_22315 [Olivibacter sp. SDN3]|uniref:hypothetical protein n=1 Tax=Olivibacter sp. SDN3 TaxID=2764720 RepID=UPI0016516FC4|nr:hypothetical protein [Olivibacter sp. SDN3]QNL49430.1 hypothetical protein H8S90_22315 [Olivibacter sp. SDN3]